MLICFDYDGVIVDSFDVLLSMMEKAHRRIGKGRAPCAEDLRTIENLAFPDLGYRMGLDVDEIDQYVSDLFKMQLDGQEAKFFPGIIDVLRALAERHTLVVVTASHSHVVTGVLREAKVDAVFTSVLGGEQRKSKAERIQAAREAYYFDQVETLMVGDAISDLRQGRLAGVKTAAVTWGYQHRTLLLAESPDFILDRPDDLMKFY